MKIEMTNQPVSLDIKRCYLPIEVTDTCPTCGAEVTKCLSSDYVSFPKVNEPTKLSMCHYIEETGEEHDWSVIVVFRVTAEAAS